MGIAQFSRCTSFIHEHLSFCGQGPAITAKEKVIHDKTVTLCEMWQAAKDNATNAHKCQA